MAQNPLFWGGLLLLGAAAGYFIRQFVVARQLGSSEEKVKKELEEARSKAKEAILEAKNKAVEIIDEAKKEERERQGQLTRLEERLLKKEEFLTARSEDAEKRQGFLDEEIGKLKAVKAETENLRSQAITALEKNSGLSGEEAKATLMREIEAKYRADLALIAQKAAQEQKAEIEKKAAEIITAALHRYSRSHVSEFTTSIVNLPGDDLKGKIIGKEGRNIRTLERLTGVEVIIDETPESLIISSFDPMRREIAKLALEKLLKDGRIQPVKIEEKVEEARSEINQKIQEYGEAAAYDVGIVDLPKEIIQLLGRLHFRSSFGQNVLTHSVEMAHVAGMLAAELGASVEIAKKGALLHDIGKAIDHDVQGTHVELGRKILQKYGVDQKVIEAMQSHHEDYPFASPESYIVTAADILSAARPGARRGTLENYLRRVEELEKIAGSFAGVKNAYALSAGRELRIFVTPEKIDDFGAIELARNIALKIQAELKYPGEIKVNVIRESRAVEYAR